MLSAEQSRRLPGALRGSEAGTETSEVKMTRSMGFCSSPWKRGAAEWLKANAEPQSAPRRARLLERRIQNDVAQPKGKMPAIQVTSDRTWPSALHFAPCASTGGFCCRLMSHGYTRPTFHATCLPADALPPCLACRPCHSVFTNFTFILTRVP